MIKETVNEYRFTEVLRQDEYAHWTYGATKALYEYYDQLSEDIGEDIELDPVAIRCEWNEYQNAIEACRQYDYIPVYESDEADEHAAREWLEERTTVLDVKNVDTGAKEFGYINSILVQEF
jgi:hypothetical protein